MINETFDTLGPGQWIRADGAAPVGTYQQNQAYIEEGKLVLRLQHPPTAQQEPRGAAVTWFEDLHFGTFEFLFKGSSGAAKPVDKAKPIKQSLTSISVVDAVNNSGFKIYMRGAAATSLFIKRWVGAETVTDEIDAHYALSGFYNKLWVRWQSSEIAVRIGPIRPKTFKTLIPQTAGKLMLSHHSTGDTLMDGSPAAGANAWAYFDSVKYEEL